LRKQIFPLQINQLVFGGSGTGGGFMSKAYFLLTFAGAALMPAMTAAQDPRAQSPYLACGADEADRSVKSKRSIARIQERAAGKCEPLLEANVANSLAAIVSQPSPSGGEYAQAEKLALKDMLREKLREDLTVIVENRVTFQRAQRAAERK
jgi:hypothetical protein